VGHPVHNLFSRPGGPGQACIALPCAPRGSTHLRFGRRTPVGLLKFRSPMSAQAQRDYGYFPPGAPYPYGPMAGPPPELPTAAELSHLNHPLLTPTLASAFSIPWAEYGGADQMGGQPGGWGAHPSAGPQDNGMPPREPHPNMGYGYSPARGGQGMPDETAQGPSGPYQNGMGGMNGMPASPYGALHPGMPPPGHPGGHPSPAMEGGPGMPPAGMPYNPQMMGYDPWEAPAMSGMPPQYGNEALQHHHHPPSHRLSSRYLSQMLCCCQSSWSPLFLSHTRCQACPSLPLG